MSIPPSKRAIACALSLISLLFFVNAAAQPNVTQSAPMNNSAERHVYVGGFAAFGSVVDVGGNIGYKTGHFRIEGEFAHSVGVDIGRPNYYGMMNIFLDMKRDWSFNPYIGIGAGVLYDGQINDESTTAAAVQGSVGFSYPLSRVFSVFVDCRYLAAVAALRGELNDDQSLTGNLGVNFYFDA
jgi:opacity protein-like surface antigen